jgi:hypothetical protein
MYEASANRQAAGIHQPSWHQMRGGMLCFVKARPIGPPSPFTTEPEAARPGTAERGAVGSVLLIENDLAGVEAKPDKE